MKKKDTIVFDVDNVLLNFSKTFSEWFNNKNTNFPQLSSNPDDYHFGYKKNTIFKKYITEFIINGVMIQLLEKDIPEIMQQLHKKYNIILLTAYPNLSARRKNLEKLNIPYDQLIFAFPNAKPTVIKKMNLNPIAVFEDRPSTIRLLIKAGIPTYVPNYWNYIKNEEWNDIYLYDNLTNLLKSKFL
jgi:HAD superfamily hydrolase (TIGR01509 family)